VEGESYRANDADRIGGGGSEWCGVLMTKGGSSGAVEASSVSERHRGAAMCAVKAALGRRGG
jgi:hypothetical protein